MRNCLTNIKICLVGNLKVLKKNGHYVEMIENSGIEFYKKWGPGDWDIRKLINEAELINDLPFVKLEIVKKWKQTSGREKI